MLLTVATWPAEPAHALAGALTFAVMAGAIAALCEPFDVQPPAVTTRLSVVVPVAPAVNAIVSMFAAEVIVPFVIVQV